MNIIFSESSTLPSSDQLTKYSKALIFNTTTKDIYVRGVNMLGNYLKSATITDLLYDNNQFNFALNYSLSDGNVYINNSGAVSAITNYIFLNGLTSGSNVSLTATYFKGLADLALYTKSLKITDLNSPTFYGETSLWGMSVDYYLKGATNQPIDQDNANSIITLYKTWHGTNSNKEGSASGNYLSLLAFPNREDIYFRYVSAGVFGNWRNLLHSGNSSISGDNITINNTTLDVSEVKVSSAALADLASKLASARTITIDGAVSGSVSFSGESDVTITTTLASGVIDDSLKSVSSSGDGNVVTGLTLSDTGVLTALKDKYLFPLGTDVYDGDDGNWGIIWRFNNNMFKPATVYINKSSNSVTIDTSYNVAVDYALEAGEVAWNSITGVPNFALLYLPLNGGGMMSKDSNIYALGNLHLGDSDNAYWVSFYSDIHGSDNSENNAHHWTIWVDGTAEFIGVTAENFYGNATSADTAAYATSAGNSAKLSDLAVTTTAATWGTIPVIRTDGVTELGRYIDFHKDNTGSVDYSTRLLLAVKDSAEYQNAVTLPSDSGTLALTSLIPTVTDYYWANVKVSSTTNSATTPTFGSVTTLKVLMLAGGQLTFNGDDLYSSTTGRPWYGIGAYDGGSGLITHIGGLYGILLATSAGNNVEIINGGLVSASDISAPKILLGTLTNTYINTNGAYLLLSSYSNELCINSGGNSNMWINYRASTNTTPTKYTFAAGSSTSRAEIDCGILTSTGIELYGSTPAINFHFDSTTASVTSQLIESESGVLSVIGGLKANSVLPNAIGYYNILGSSDNYWYRGYVKEFYTHWIYPLDGTNLYLGGTTSSKVDISGNLTAGSIDYTRFFGDVLHKVSSLSSTTALRNNGFDITTSIRDKAKNILLLQRLLLSDGSFELVVSRDSVWDSTNNKSKLLWYGSNTCEIAPDLYTVDYMLVALLKIYALEEIIAQFAQKIISNGTITKSDYNSIMPSYQALS